MKSLFFLPLLMLLALSCQSCQQGKGGTEKSSITYRFDLAHPDTVFHLPAALKEISGIAAVNDSLIACVADEKGIVYFFQTTTGRIISQLPFGPDADYEDITMAEDTLYVLDSKGIIWVIRDFRRSPVISSHSLSLSGSFELEALYAWHRELYIGAKHHHQQSRQPVWKWHPGSEMTLVFSIPDRVSTDIKANTSFHLSGFTIDSATGEWICLSANKPVLARYHSDGVITATISLERSLYPQPEGICFSPDGHLMIANEGQDGSASLLMFHPKFPE